jgi:carboxypeptidase PM20D1
VPAITSPGATGTDARLYSEVAENVYRFQPILLTADDLKGPHGVNEHMSLANFERLIRFYIGVMDAGAMR